MEIYKNWKIHLNEWKLWEAYNLNDCDAPIKFDKSLEMLKADIDESEE